jgi:hypothetical protein
MRAAPIERAEIRDETTIAVTGKLVVAVAPSGFSLLSSLDRGISHLSSPC